MLSLRHFIMVICVFLLLPTTSFSQWKSPQIVENRVDQDNYEYLLDLKQFGNLGLSNTGLIIFYDTCFGGYEIQSGNTIIGTVKIEDSKIVVTFNKMISGEFPEDLSIKTSNEGDSPLESTHFTNPIIELAFKEPNFSLAVSGNSTLVVRYNTNSELVEKANETLFNPASLSNLTPEEMAMLVRIQRRSGIVGSEKSQDPNSFRIKMKEEPAASTYVDPLWYTRDWDPNFMDKRALSLGNKVIVPIASGAYAGIEGMYAGIKVGIEEMYAGLKAKAVETWTQFNKEWEADKLNGVGFLVIEIPKTVVKTAFETGLTAGDKAIGVTGKVIKGTAQGLYESAKKVGVCTYNMGTAIGEKDLDMFFDNAEDVAMNGAIVLTTVQGAVGVARSGAMVMTTEARNLAALAKDAVNAFDRKFPAGSLVQTNAGTFAVVPVAISEAGAVALSGIPEGSFSGLAENSMKMAAAGNAGGAADKGSKGKSLSADEMKAKMVGEWDYPKEGVEAMESKGILEDVYKLRSEMERLRDTDAFQKSLGFSDLQNKTPEYVSYRLNQLYHDELISLKHIGGCLIDKDFQLVMEFQIVGSQNITGSSFDKYIMDRMANPKGAGAQIFKVFSTDNAALESRLIEAQYSGINEHLWRWLPGGANTHAQLLDAIQNYWHLESYQLAQIQRAVVKTAYEGADKLKTLMDNLSICHVSDKATKLARIADALEKAGFKFE